MRSKERPERVESAEKRQAREKKKLYKSEQHLWLRWNENKHTAREKKSTK